VFELLAAVREGRLSQDELNQYYEKEDVVDNFVYNDPANRPI